VRGSRGDAARPGRIGFAGARRDARTGLVYLRNRFYSPELGRFLSRDPIGLLDLAIPGASNPLQAKALRHMPPLDRLEQKTFSPPDRPAITPHSSKSYRRMLTASLVDVHDSNLYAYVHNAPLLLADPEGLMVTNNSSFIVWIKPESTGTAISLAPGDVYPGRQDGISVPQAKRCQVYKSVDFVDLTVNADGSVSPRASSSVKGVAQWWSGGWKDIEFNRQRHKEKDRGWDELFSTVGATHNSEQCCP